MLLNEEIIVDKEIEYLLSCYKKLKYHYYYNKGNVFIREKIALFENEKKTFKEALHNLDKYIKNPENTENQKYISNLVSKIDYFILPKNFTEKKHTGITSNLSNKKLNKVNFFIDMPIELHILDTYWTILLATLDKKDKCINNSIVFGNTIDENLFSKGSSIINNNRILFNNYYIKYSQWKTNTYDHILENFKSSKSTLLLKFDIKDYYYNVQFDFNFNNYFPSYKFYPNIQKLTDLFHSIYFEYFNKIKMFRHDLQNFDFDKMPLPLGLFSSMFISNLYLTKIDNFFKKSKSIHFGRYVDDFLVCIDKELEIEELDNLNKTNEIYMLGITEAVNILKIKGYMQLELNEDKIETLYFSKFGSKKLIEKYYDTLKPMPSDISFSSMDTLDLEEDTQIVENFDIENYIDVLRIKNINRYKITRFFNVLKNQYINTKSKTELEPDVAEYEKDKAKIDSYFKDNQILENYSNWQNYLYFLVLCNDNLKIHSFYVNTDLKINQLDTSNLDLYYSNTKYILDRIKLSLKKYLNIVLNFSLSIDLNNTDILIDNISNKQNILAIYNSNMFDNNLIELPLFNFLSHKNRFSYKDIKINNIFDLNSQIIDISKFELSPRFIYSHEIDLLISILKAFNLFNNQFDTNKLYTRSNSLLNPKVFQENKFKVKIDMDYFLNKIEFQGLNQKNLSSIKIAIVNVDLNLSCINDLTGNWSYLENKNRFDTFQKILHESVYDVKNKTDILVFPELYLPFNWINDLVTFSRKNNIAVITGMKYVESMDRHYHNFILSIYPIKKNKHSPYQVYIDIREKNDYSYLEKYDNFFTTNNMKFKDLNASTYNIFDWNSIKISSLLCFEVTDIICRGLHKNNIDLLLISEANKDTNYFSSIVNSTSRDLHTIIVQSNISCYGDSKITGPYKTEVKDKVIIKGGINANVIIGEINLKMLKDYQSKFKIHDVDFINSSSEKNSIYKNIKKPPARFFSNFNHDEES